MTKKKSLKQRVRERQQKTGERYTTARSHLVTPLPTGEGRERGALRGEVSEPLDITALAKESGLTCTASVSHRVPPAQHRVVLESLKALLQALGSDTGAAKMSHVLLRGEPGEAVSANGIAEAVEARSFMQTVASARRGVSTNGRCAAFDVEGQTVIATMLWHSSRPAFLYLAPLDANARGPWTELFTLAGIGGFRTGQ